MMGNYHVRFDRGLRGKVSKDNSPLCLPNSGAGQSPCERSFCPAEEIGPILTVYLILVYVSAKIKIF